MRYRWLEWRRLALGAAAGLVLAAAFPKIGLTGLAWIAPGLMLSAALGTSGGTAFRTGYVAGLAYYLASLYWLLLIPVPVAPVVGWVALSGFLALYPALWVWLCSRVAPGRVSPAGNESRLGGAFALEALDGLLRSRWWQRAAWALACAAFWVAWEMAQARVLTGFPWNFLGVSQYPMLPLIQVASITGVYGVSFLVAWFSVALISAVAVLIRQPSRRTGALAEVMVPLLGLAAALSWGARQLVSPPLEGRQVTMTLVQPSIPQTTIWDPKQAAARFQEVLALSEQALQRAKPEVMVWPEAAVPGLFLWDREPLYHGKTLYQAVTDLARRYRVWLILGADDAAPQADNPNEADYYNSSFLVDPNGEVVGRYRKQKLVIFGEYVPLSRWLPFLKDFTQVYGEFKPGKRPAPFSLEGLGVKTSVLICFEDTFPHLARDYVEPDTDFLLNLTNNGWFGESAAQWQHAANALFRAVENGLPLVRAANNGLSCWVDAQGRMHDVYFQGSDNIYQAGYKIARVPVLGSAHRRTYYRAHGDWFGWGCVGVAGLAVLAELAPARLRRGRRSPVPASAE